MGVDRDLGAAEGEDHHAGGRLAPDAGQRDEVARSPRRGGLREPVEVGSPPRPSSRRTCWIRGAFGWRSPPGRIASSTSSTGGVADLLPGRQRVAQPLVGDVAIAVVGVLGEDRQHQLGDRVPVRIVDRAAVDLAQPVADRAHPGSARPPPGRLCWSSPSRAGYFPRRWPRSEERVVDVDGVRCFYRRSPATARRRSSCTATRRTRRTGSRSSNGSTGPASPSTCPAWAFRAPAAAASTTRCTAWRASSSASRRARGRRALARRPRLGRVGLIAAQRAPGAGPAARRDQRRPAAARLPLALDRRCLWRVPGAGELANRTTTKAGLRDAPRQASATPGRMPAEFIDSVWAGRVGSWPAMLELYRSADPERLAAAGERPRRARVPGAGRWGDGRPYLPPRFGRAYAARSERRAPRARPGAGHWPWIDRPDASIGSSAFCR